MFYRHSVALLISFSILLYSCSGYKEVIRSDKSVGRANLVYLYFDKNYYTLHDIQDQTNYYLAEATITENPTQNKKSVIIYTNDITILSTNQEILSISIDKNQIYKYTKTVRKSEKPLTVIGLVAIAVIIVWVTIDNEENKMKIHAHE